MDRIGPYDILGELGRGGMGVVYRARNAELDREFALKVMRPSGLGGAGVEEVARFRREAQAAAALAGHPGIVPVHDVGVFEHDGREELYLAMPLVEGRGLDGHIDDGDIDATRATAWLAQVARAVQHAHDHGVIHRDLKPANIMIATDGRALVTDFGLAKHTATSGELTKLTQTGVVLGTPAFMAPEQAQGRVSPQADVYSLGATLYEALLGEPPFTGDSAMGVLRRLLSETPTPLRTRDPRIPRDLDVIVMRCLEKSPEARPASAGELADELERFGRGDPILSRPPGLIRNALRHPKRVAAVAALIAAGVAAVPVAQWMAGTTAADAGTQKQIDETRDQTEERSLAQELSAAWQDLSLRTLEPMRRLEDLSCFQLPPRHDGPAALDEVKRIAAEAAAAHPRSGLPAAWVAVAEQWAEAGSDWTAVRGAIARAPDDPFPRLLFARVLLAAYIGQIPMARTELDGTTKFSLLAKEPDHLVPLREEAQAMLQQVQRLPVTAHIRQGTELVQLLRGAELFLAGEFDAAAQEIEQVAGHATLEGVYLNWSAVSRLFAGQFVQAERRFERLLARRWADSPLRMAQAMMEQDDSQRVRGQNSTEHRERALALLDSVLAEHPTWANGLSRRSVVHRSIAGSKARVQDLAGARDHYARAIADGRLAMTGRNEDWRERWRLSMVYRSRGLMTGRRPEETVRDLRTALTLIDDVAAMAGGDVQVVIRRAGFRAELAQNLLAMGRLQEADAANAGAMEDADAALAARPEDALLMLNRAALGRAWASTYLHRDRTRAGALLREAEEWCTKSLVSEHDRHRAFITRGRIRLDSCAVQSTRDATVTRLRLSLDDFDAAAAIDAEDVRIWMFRGSAWGALSQFLTGDERIAAAKQSAADLRRAVAADQNTSGLRARLAITLLQLGEVDEALATAKSAVAIEPSDPQARQALQMCEAAANERR